MKKEDEYRLAFEIHDKKAHIIVYEPIITKEERERRMNELKKAVQDFWVNHYRQQARKAMEAERSAYGQLGK